MKVSSGAAKQIQQVNFSSRKMEKPFHPSLRFNDKQTASRSCLGLILDPQLILEVYLMNVLAKVKQLE